MSQYRELTYAPIGAEAVMTEDGLEILKGFVDRSVPQQPIHKSANIEYIACDVGRVELLATPAEQHYNLAGSVHGGWMATVLDSALGGSVLSVLKPGETFTTIEFKVNLMRGVTADGTSLTCTGMLTRRGRSIAVSTAELKDVEGRLIAQAVGTCMILTAPAN